MEQFDRHDELALRRLDDLALEEIRVQMVGDSDTRLGLVVRELVLRAVRAIESVCRTRGADRGLSREQVLKAIDDASVRLLLRFRRPPTASRRSPPWPPGSPLLASMPRPQRRRCHHA